ncbi:MAG TPA: LysR family transcriptional regulator [Alphaproteobacteria bacterium]|jgi:DNA-binding transcriptional LysR family regulator|nr:LysR family transcriptional regulator [Alphaproteobacteria bacterium]MDP6271356.1 LysR family transcriptional regulator [Alphaproteobacteria bacterium]MDP7163953.1 LysR family transcriptional regulator [Alphaproteobacteria bacterium]MDP7429255.1 LysR family transcriptional regulator [Alphaproteobacteria bacterium]HJM48865.1 LysR family transcriptional regulator [Alphaproteobacteria bacterium]
MNIEHIRTFLEIATTGNFNVAADHLNVTQSTVSARIKALEERLDQPVFLRGRNGVEMTAAGHHFHRHAVTMLRAWEQGRQIVSLPEGFQGMLGVGTQVSLWERLIAHWLPWMRAQAPDVALRLQSDYSESLMRQLSDGLLDVAVMYSPRATPGLEIRKLLEERLVLVSTQRRKLAAGWPEDYVFVDWGPEFHSAHSESFPHASSSAVSVGLGAIGLQYILVNGGSGYFPLRVVRPYLAERRLFRVAKAPVFQRPAYLVYPTQPPDEDLVALAVRGLIDVAAMEKER